MFFLFFICLVSFSDTANAKDCRLDPHPSVEFQCLVSGEVEGTRTCATLEPPGTVVKPRCRLPNYFTATPLALMHCYDGYWDYVARCTPECGRVTPDGKVLVVGGRRVRRGELPWHAGIYKTTTKPYKQICGGSLLSTNIVISVAHCFWSDVQKQLPASEFAVAVGKLYRPWNDPNDEAQKSQVKVIHLPQRYQGAAANYQDDIAVLVVAEEFRFETHVRPVCLSFDYLFEVQQLAPGAKGKVAGWGRTGANGASSPVLLTVDLPYVDVGTCIRDSRPDYREYITSDKICAGTLDSNAALCEGDSGGGLAFPESIRGVQRYFLRGLVSTAPTSTEGDACNTATYTSFTSTQKHEHFIKKFWVELGEFKCADGGHTSAAKHCDGTRDCADGSDETAAACAGHICSAYLFRCAYGACVDRGATCDGFPDCADGSDETDELCSPGGRPLSSADAKPGACILPPQPAHGEYISNIDGALPGRGYDRVTLSVTCARGYGTRATEPKQIYCYQGTWTAPLPECVQMCELTPSPSVIYVCLDRDGEERACGTFEHIGTVVRPQCARPHYFAKRALPYMRCVDGEWDNLPKCSPECGRTYSGGQPLINGGDTARRGEMPWHAVLYRKKDIESPHEKYMQINGATLVRSDVVITVAHAFVVIQSWKYAIAVGKVYRKWDEILDFDAQKSEVKEIHTAPRFNFAGKSFQDDIAVVIVRTPFVFNTAVSPVCLDFDVAFEERQLQNGNKGKIAGWDIQSGRRELQVLSIPYVDVNTCLKDFPEELFTSDKICAGTLNNDTGICKGDSGGGLVFPAIDRAGIERYYLRGIISTAKFYDDSPCSTIYTGFTEVQKHKGLIKTVGGEDGASSFQ